MMPRTYRAYALPHGPHAIQTCHAGDKINATKKIDITGERRGFIWSILERAEAGVRITYHVGEFCAGPHRADARAAYEAGAVLLTMRKIEQGRFEYMAIVRR